MSGALFKRLFGGESIIAALERDVAGERVLFQSDVVRGVKSFSGRVPGLRSSGSKNWFRAAFAITDTRVVAYGRRSKIVDVGYAMEADGPATLTLDSDGLRVVWDMDRVHPACRGEMKLEIRAPIAETVRSQVPTTRVSFNVDPQKVVRLTGSMKKLPEPST